MSVLTDAAADAPRTPGVYFFLGERGGLLYVGKANDLRRRLGDHARTPTTSGRYRNRMRLDLVRSVRWEECVDEEDAFAREADLIVLLRPRYNASHTAQDPNVYLRVTDGPKGTTFDLTTDLADAGCFPHLEKGSFSHTAKVTKTGFTALLRLLWAAEAGTLAERIPGRISGPTPPHTHTAPMGAETRVQVDDFLAGRSPALVTSLWQSIAASDLPDYMQPALDRDAMAAAAFFEVGPKRMHALRTRHGLPNGPIDPKTATKLLRSEIS
jgi:predicted GIY-YIG superfamily endonuclease